eukprot:gene10353-12690_t
MSALLAAGLIMFTSAAVVAQTSLSPAAGPTAVPDRSPPDGFVMSGGKVFTVHRGLATPLDREMVLRVGPAGITGFDQ